jgi:hypothetical protein
MHHLYSKPTLQWWEFGKCLSAALRSGLTSSRFIPITRSCQQTLTRATLIPAIPTAKGVWKGRKTVTGIFKEYNADRTSHKFVSILTVTYTITVKGDTFTGDALAVVTDANTGAELFRGPATFTATRMKLP